MSLGIAGKILRVSKKNELSPDLSVFDMVLIKGDANIAEECVKIAGTLPDYFTDSGVVNLVQDVKKHQLFAAIDSGRVIGFIVVAEKYAQVAEILWLAVKRELQHKGYGSALIEHASIVLKKKGIRLLEVKTLAPQAGYQPYEATRRFYDKNGFMLTEVIDPYPGWEPGNPRALYVKIL